MFNFVRPRFFPPRDLTFTIGAASGDIERTEVEARIRRWDISASKDSSKGRENSSRKKGCLDKFAVGEGDRIDTGVELLELGDS